MDFTAITIRNVFFPLMELVKGNTIRKKLKYLKEMESASCEKILSIQQDNLKTLLLHCINNVPAYKDYADLKTLIEKNPSVALQKFPVLSKNDYKKNIDSFIASNYNKEKLIENTTGGSTGIPLKFFMDRETVEWYEAARYLGLSRFGINIGDRSILLWANPLDLSNIENKKYFRKEKYLKNRIIIPAFNLVPERMKDYIELINDYKPVFVYGYTSQIYLFAQLMNNENLKLNFKLKAVVSTSETIYNHQRILIEKVFKCNLINEYGARDAGIIAYEDTSGQLRINCLNIYTEVLNIENNSIITDCSKGEIITTDLHNFASPRLRYRLGDVISISKNKMTLNSVSGRVNSVFKAVDGRLVHGELTDYLTRDLDSIEQFQFIHHSPQSGTIKIVKSKKFKEVDVSNITKKIKEILGEQEIKIEYVDNIKPLSSGKLQCNIREYDL